MSNEKLNVRLTCFYTSARKKYDTYCKSNKEMVEKAFSEVENLIKQLFCSPLLGTRLVIANEARSAELAIYHLVSNKGERNDY